ncbi:MAG: ABC transporter permease [candidate division Zixibacteria bacterium]|nr:ABC transporter permease [candidate division Zixibacteria bacterium]
MYRIIKAIAKKELSQVMRDPNMLRIIFVMPFIQLLVLGYAITTDVKKIYTSVYDYDRSGLSREYVRSLSAGGYFITGSSNISLLEADKGFRENKYNATLIIPGGFSAKLRAGQPVKIGFMVDGANANSAAIALGYINFITGQYNLKISGLSQSIMMRQKRLYNPEGESVDYMVPGIVTLLLTMITMVLTSMAIVREREVGTLEQLMVTPISTPALILGKTIPFAILGFVEMSAALAFGVLWFHVPFVGSWLLLYVLTFIFLFTTLGMGMFVSTISKTQQQAMFLTWFFSIFAIMTSGLFAPIANMPQSIQYLTYLNPLRYFMKIVRAIMMKGATLNDLYPEALAMMAFGMAIFTSAWLRFSKRVK